MSTAAERLAEYKRKTSPFSEVLSHIQYVKGDQGPQGEQGEKGDKGDKGEKGDTGPQGEQGERGTDGKHGRHGIDGTNGKDGKNGVDGKDGRDGKDAKIPKIEVSYKDIKDAPSLKDLEELIKFLKAGGFRGGGDTVAAGTNVTITNVGGVKTINAQGGSSGFTILQPTETPNGSLTVFTFAAATAQPSVIVSDNVWLQATTKSGTVNWTWNAGLKQATLTIPPLDDVYGIV